MSYSAQRAHWPQWQVVSCLWLMLCSCLGACSASDDCADACNAGKVCPEACSHGVTATSGTRTQRADDVTAWAPTRAPASAVMSQRNDAGTRVATVIQLPRSLPDQSARARTTDDDAGMPPACIVRNKVEVCDGLDDDCDHKVDEGCVCVDGKNNSCYDGPAETLSVGVCRAGEQRCEQGTWRACTGTVTPQAETCNELDDDCDGRVDEGFAFASDPEHCGKCGRSCGQDSTCCEGQCVDLSTDYQHCGACGARCSTGKLPGCCGGSCVDLLTDRTCGSCSNACGLLKLGGGFLCHCQQVENGPACVGDAVGMGLQVCR